MTTDVLVDTVAIDNTSIVVTSNEYNQPVSIVETERIVAKVSEGHVVVTGMLGIPAARSIGASTDVNISNLEDGSVLVYSADTHMWVATRSLEKQNITGGFF